MIIIKDLSKSYDNLIVHQRLNVKIKENQITSLLGPSGCGKTTLLRILAGLEPFDSGEIIGVQGKKIAYLFQEDRLMPWLTAEENIAYVLKSKYMKEQVEEKIDSIFELIQLQGYKNYGIDKLSGGMKRRIALGRALAYDGELLLLDEPFKGLDDALKESLYEGVKAYFAQKPCTVINVTHDKKEAEYLGEYIYLDSKSLIKA